jgi:hypothetical protein
MATGPAADGRHGWVCDAVVAVAAAGVAIAACAAWIPLRASVPNVDVAVVLLAGTALAGFSGRRAAVVGAALAAAAGFSYFDTEPYERWAITHGTDVVTTVLLVVVGLGAGELALRLGCQRRLSVAEGRRFERVREAAARLAQGEELVPMIGAVADELGHVLHLASCRFSTEPDDEALPSFDRGGQLNPPTLAPGPVALPVLSLGAVVGRFVLEPGDAAGWSHSDVVLATALADQVGAALAAQAPFRAPEDAPPAPPGPSAPFLRVVR